MSVIFENEYYRVIDFNRKQDRDEGRTMRMLQTKYSVTDEEFKMIFDKLCETLTRNEI